MFTDENIIIDRLEQRHFLQYAFGNDTVTFYYLDEHPEYERLVKKNLIYRISRKNGYDVLIEKKYYETVRPLFNENCMKAEYEFNTILLRTRDKTFVKQKALHAFLLSLILPILILGYVILFDPDRLDWKTYAVSFILVPLLTMSSLNFMVIRPIHKANVKMDRVIFDELGQEQIDRLVEIDQKYLKNHPLLNSEEKENLGEV